ncbi:hypothetical protein BDW42DRAFT_169159 [Aspergillus taichungensis]|uniref:Uncharacterized protein n=1 Tax=Aspergillus taichungensis TaxID=482145 RepID=A0A2J5HV91_9EURO|nr:hypothetical protein BDW42DRAFT_169159 [Aspergillus taichungensis]
MPRKGLLHSSYYRCVHLENTVSGEQGQEARVRLAFRKEGYEIGTAPAYRSISAALIYLLNCVLLLRLFCMIF